MVFCFELQAGEFRCPYLEPSFILSASMNMAQPYFRHVFLERIERGLGGQRDLDRILALPSHLGGFRPSLSLISSSVERHAANT